MPYGLALIVITVIIKLLFWPLTQASTRSMKRMQALQPEIKKLQEKYKEDPAKQQKKMMELWKEHKVNPMSGCWPMLIQLPIFFALFRMIPNAIELRGTPFLWIADLSRPDTIWYIPGLDFPFNPLPLLMGVTMLWQARLTPAAPGMDPAQQAIMKYMPLMFMVFLYNQPSGLTLYWTVQNLLTILQTKLTKAQEQKTAAVTSPLAPPKKKLKG
jgi:YidC/Oxa1 family membrane protein insertase